MREERRPGELPEPRASSFKVALGIAGSVIALGLLACGGLAAYVAGTAPSEESQEAAAPPTLFSPESTVDPATVALIDLPPDFERSPIRMPDPLSPMKTVAFRRKTDGAELLVGRLVSSAIPADITQEKLRATMLKKLELTGELSAKFQRVADSLDRQRELSPLGQQASVEITDGTLDQSAKSAVKLTGWFRTEKGRIAVVCIIPRDGYDEDAAVKIFESIQPPAGDSMAQDGVSAHSAE